MIKPKRDSFLTHVKQFSFYVPHYMYVDYRIMVCLLYMLNMDKYARFHMGRLTSSVGFLSALCR